jgi:uncharacterized membrane protein YcjF (UPF0283 family)
VKKKNKLVLLQKSESQQLDFKSMSEKSGNQNSILDTFMKKRSSTQSEDNGRRNRDHSGSSIFSNRSIIKLTKTQSIEGLHTFNLKQCTLSEREDSEHSYESKTSFKA